MIRFTLVVLFLPFIFSTSLLAQNLHPQEISGDSLRQLTKAPAAVVAYELASSAYQHTGQWEQYVAVKNKIAALQLRMEEYEKGLENIDQAISTARQYRTSVDSWWRLFRTKEQILSRIRAYDATMAAADSAIHYLPAHHPKKHELSADIFETAATTALGGFDYGKSLMYGQQALKSYQAAGKDSVQYAYKTYQVLAYAAENLGNLSEATHWQQKIDRYIVTLDLTKAEIQTMILIANSAGFYIRLENWEKALSYAETALMLDQRIFVDKPSPFRIMLLNNLSAVHMMVGQWKSAHETFQEVAKIIRQKKYTQPMPYQEMLNYLDLAEVLGELENNEAAKQAFDQATQLLPAQQDSLGIQTYWERAANYHISIKQYAEAVKANKIYIDILEQRKQFNQHYVTAHTVQGNAYQRLGQYDDAKVYYERALALYCDSHHSSLQTDCFATGNFGIATYNGYAYVLQQFARRAKTSTERLSYLQRGVENVHKALNIQRHMQRTYYRGALETYQPWLRDAPELYSKAIDILLDIYHETKDHNYVQEAFKYVEDSKSLVLEKALLTAQAKAFGNLPDSLLQQEKSLTRQIAVLEKRVAEAEGQDNEAQVGLLRDEALFKVKRQYEQLLLTFESQFPAYYRLRYDTARFTFQQICDKLAPKTLLLSYTTSPDSNKLYIFCLSSAQGLQVVETPLQANVETQIKTLRTLLQSVFLNQKSHRQQFVQLSHQLYNQYLLPVAKQLEKAEHLVIVGEGLMQALPFEVLLPSAPDLPLTDLPYLVREKRVSYHYSAKFIGDQSSSPQTNNVAAVLAFAPVFNEENVEMQYAGNVRSFLDGFGEFTPLPYSEKEVRTLRQLYTSEQFRLLLRKAASEQALKAALQQPWKIVHLASHSFINLGNAKFSGIACYPDSTGGEDGILYVNEIYPLTLNADLVTLSSCESGMGQVTTREGILGINRAFLYTGVRNIVFSLWKANDRATSLLMQQFYEQVAAGKSYSEALRMAKLSLLTHPDTASPNFWANFGLIGF